MKSTATLSSALPVRLAARADLHLARKAWHLLMGILMITIYSAGMSRGTAVSVLGLVLAAAIVMETVRLRVPAINEVALKFWGPLMRSSEAKQMSGLPFYVGGALLSIAIFPKPIALLALLYLACGDPMASLVGILYGHKSYRLPGGKSLIGTSAGIAVCTVVSVLFLSTMGITGAPLIALTLMGGIAGGTAELLPLDVDDNFSIPVVSGFVLWLGFILCGV